MPPIHYLSAERDLVRSAERIEGIESLLAVGGPDFDAPQGPLPRDDVRIASAVTPETDVPRVVYRGPTIACDDFRSLRFEPLPASLDEIGEVAGLWDEDAGIVRLTGRFAREDSFKRYAGDHRVVHMATHAFFVPGECVAPKAGHMENPLRLSGLVLAGANRRNEAGPEDEDGILTAEEIASLDLSSVEWAVLSGCDTGAGDVIPGEGVLGLRRAFEIAGARTLIMSLWPVEDEATRALMKELYRGRTQGLSTAEAVRRASLARLEASRKAGRGTHPFYWGAFVAAGDWR